MLFTYLQSAAAAAAAAAAANCLQDWFGTDLKIRRIGQYWTMLEYVLEVSSSKGGSSIGGGSSSSSRDVSGRMLMLPWVLWLVG
jgi:uncharacterized membrane protein YgcG